VLKQINVKLLLQVKEKYFFMFLQMEEKMMPSGEWKSQEEK
jgi:hypothetical protein